MVAKLELRGGVRGRVGELRQTCRTSLPFGAQLGIADASVQCSESRIDIWDAGAVSPPASEFVRLNDCIHNFAFYSFGAMNEGSGN